MKHFNYSIYLDEKWDLKIINYVARIHEEKGKEQFILKAKKDELVNLVNIAKIKSTQSSNEIENIRTTNLRIKQLFEKDVSPKNRDEASIIGYKEVLELINENYNDITISPNSILYLHKVLLSYSASEYAGKLKTVQNYISATNKDGKIYTLFTPLAPFDTPIALEELCNEYNRAIAKGLVDPLILIPIFINDFLSIHPFTDGNGRLSRLLTNLLLYKAGYFIAKFISLEAKIAKTKELYYDCLYSSQKGWHNNSEVPNSFIEYILSIIVSAYNDFNQRVDLINHKTLAIDKIRLAINAKITRFTKNDILELIPSLSSTSVERSLKELCHLGEIKKEGIGKKTYYLKLK